MTKLIVADTATVIDVEVHEGETWRMDYEVVDKFGAPVPVAGFAVKARVVDALDSGNPPYFTFDSTAGDGSAVAAAGTSTSVRLIATAAQTAAWLWRSAMYDVRVTDLSSNVGYIAKGKFTVIPSA